MNVEFIAILDFAFGGGWWKINEQEFISESILLLSYVVLISLANLCAVDVKGEKGLKLFNGAM